MFNFDEVTPECDLGRLQVHHPIWKAKYAIMRSVCKEVGIDVPIMRYIVTSPMSEREARAAVARVLAPMRTRFVQIRDGGSYNHKKRPEQLLEHIRELSDGFGNPISLLVEEFQGTVACGTARLNPDGTILARTVPGSLAGLKMNAKPTSYHLDSTGAILTEDIRPTHQYSLFDRTTLTFRPVQVDKPIWHALSDGDRIQIATILNRLGRALGPTGMKWVHDGERVELYSIRNGL